MDRVIKFRGRRIDNGEWVYGDLYQEKYPFENKIKEVCIVEYRPDLALVSGAPINNHWWVIVDPKTVGQFTGLKDKNGTEIYEGDIIEAIPYIRISDETIKGKVFMSDQGRWMVEEIDPKYSETELLYECVKSQRSKVIGNIHQPQ